MNKIKLKIALNEKLLMSLENLRKICLNLSLLNMIRYKLVFQLHKLWFHGTKIEPLNVKCL